MVTGLLASSCASWPKALSIDCVTYRKVSGAGTRHIAVGILCIARYDLMGLYTGVVGWPRPDQTYWAIRVIVAATTSIT
jgi:hypothetical protein